MLEDFQTLGKFITKNQTKKEKKKEENKPKQKNVETKKKETKKHRKPKKKTQKENGSFANFSKNLMIDLDLKFFDLQDLFGLHLFSTIQDDQVFSLSAVHNSFVQSKLFDHLGITQQFLDRWLARIEQIYIQNEILLFTSHSSKNTKNKFQLSPYWKQHFLKIWTKELETIFKQNNKNYFLFSKARRSKAIGMTSYLTFQKLRNGSNTRETISQRTGFNKQRISVVLSIFKGLGFVKEQKGQLFFQKNLAQILPYLKDYNLRLVELRKKRRNLSLQGKQLAEKLLSRMSKTNQDLGNNNKTKELKHIEIYKNIIAKMNPKKEKYICEIVIHKSNINKNNTLNNIENDVKKNNFNKNYNNFIDNRQQQQQPEEEDEDEEEEETQKKSTTNIYKENKNQRYQRHELKSNKKKKKKKKDKPSEKINPPKQFYVKQKEKNIIKKNSNYLRKKKIQSNSLKKINAKIKNEKHKDFNSKNKIKAKNKKKKNSTINKQISNKRTRIISPNMKNQNKINIIESPINYKIIPFEKNKKKKPLTSYTQSINDPQELKMFIDDKQQLQTINNSKEPPQILLSIQQNQKHPTLTISFPKMGDSDYWLQSYGNHDNENKKKNKDFVRNKKKIQKDKESTSKNFKMEQKQPNPINANTPFDSKILYNSTQTPDITPTSLFTNNTKTTPTSVNTPNFWNIYHGLNKINFPSQHNPLDRNQEDFFNIKSENIGKENSNNHDLNLNYNGKSYEYNTNKLDDQDTEKEKQIKKEKEKEKRKEKKQEEEKDTRAKTNTEQESILNSKTSYNNFMKFVDEQSLDLNQQKNTNFQIDQTEPKILEHTFVPNLYDRWFVD
ncbi:myb-like protein x [Anaeramoeba flamelloides]|uniref:Myb-like protein x n=1 Tax=Anaeramoeba flamelloides TaxID=1746091 RepID=A0ABQ8YNJ4_9EUKA|nr:myb-like protein x [Anaeramoeba flamelloides]